MGCVRGVAVWRCIGMSGAWRWAVAAGERVDFGVAGIYASRVDTDVAAGAHLGFHGHTRPERDERPRHADVRRRRKPALRSGVEGLNGRGEGNGVGEAHIRRVIPRGKPNPWNHALQADWHADRRRTPAPTATDVETITRGGANQSKMSQFRDSLNNGGLGLCVKRV